jgi:hypothetical protein
MKRLYRKRTTDVQNLNTVDLDQNSHTQMSRYKGRASLKVIESKFPHHVDMMVRGTTLACA